MPDLRRAHPGRPRPGARRVPRGWASARPHLASPPLHRLLPRITLESLYGPGVVFTPRAPPGGRHYLRYGATEAAFDSFTGTFLTIGTGATTLCSAGCVTEAVRALLGEAGGFPGPFVSYHSMEEYGALLGAAAAQGSRIAFQHSHDPGVVPADSQLVDPLLISFLNNKANLAALVPPGYAPPRRVAEREQAAALGPTAARPVVLKLATDRSNGAGGAVVIARSATDIAAALRRFPADDPLIVEDFIPHTRSLCLNFAATGEGVLFLGGADQVVDRQGVHQGSLLGKPSPRRMEEAVEVGFEIARGAVARGYRGIAGFDVAFGESLPHPIVFDLNFRFCASTLPLIWFASIAEQQRGNQAGRMSVVSGPADFVSLAARLREGVAGGALFPYAAFEPAVTEHTATAPSARLLIVGEHWRQVEDRLAALRGTGLLCT